MNVNFDWMGSKIELKKDYKVNLSGKGKTANIIIKEVTGTEVTYLRSDKTSLTVSREKFQSSFGELCWKWTKISILNENDLEIFYDTAY